MSPGISKVLSVSLIYALLSFSPNKLTIQMLAQVLSPVPNLQYVAIGFSDDNVMVIFQEC